jgi:ABC-type Na+ efflux pump permease subunit
VNVEIIRRLIAKDWYLQRYAIGGYLSAGAISVVFLSAGGNGSFYAGTILLITALMAMGLHLTMASIVGERTEQTLPFVMTLPVSSRDYTAAKVVGTLSMFLMPWTALIAATLAVLVRRSAETRALIPFTTLTVVELFAAFALLLFVAVTTESQAWTIGVMVASNLFFQAYLYSVTRLPAIARGMKAGHAVWSSTVLSVLGIEIAVIVSLLVLTFVVRSRKTDFL